MMNTRCYVHLGVPSGKKISPKAENKNKQMKKYITTLLLVVTCFTSCYKDKGNYDYIKQAEITVEGIPEKIEVLSKIERIVVTPKIISSKEGEIKADNPNYTFRYRLGYKSYGVLGGVVNGRPEAWVDLPPTNGFNLDVPADFEADNYMCWFTITDKRNNVVHSHVFDITITSTTYQGWMVLSNMGQEERVRLDMISHISDTRTEVVYDIAEGLPEIHHGTQIAYYPRSNERIYIFSKEGSYQLDIETLKSDPSQEFNQNNFFIPPADKMISFASMAISTVMRLSFAFSDAGDVYSKNHTISGGVYGYPINTTLSGEQFKVAPFVGVNEMRPSQGTRALFYDRDNKRFMGATYVSGGDISRMYTLFDPSTKLFSFQTGRDMIYMEGTRRSNGLVYSILQDAQGKRSIYGINMSGIGFKQELYIENVSAPGFEQATLFAFHSQFPFLFYAVGSKVYLYNLATKTATEMTNITGGEITALKFNLYKIRLMTDLNNQTDEFLNQQFQLIVGTYNNSADGNGGKVALYEVDGTSNTVNKLHEYGGFGKVKDVTYRERAK